MGVRWCRVGVEREQTRCRTHSGYDEGKFRLTGNHDATLGQPEVGFRASQGVSFMRMGIAFFAISVVRPRGHCLHGTPGVSY